MDATDKADAVVIMDIQGIMPCTKTKPTHPLIAQSIVHLAGWKLEIGACEELNLVLISNTMLRCDAGVRSYVKTRAGEESRAPA